VRVLSVLAIATPCPLIIAAPVALLAGVNNCAKNGIIVKKLENLETVSQTTTLIFDKTGTITIGKARLVDFELRDKRYLPEQVIGIAAAIERNSLHPLAKSILDYAKKKKIPIIAAQDIHEEVGKGIVGVVNGKKYRISRFPEKNGTFLSVGIFDNKKILGVFRFQDEIKPETAAVIDFLKKLNIKIFVFTGDRKEIAEAILKDLGNIYIRAEMKPQDKKKGIEELKKHGEIVAMVGDNINDAPALATADVGMVFVASEQTAASEAADIVLLGADFSLVKKTIVLAKQTVKIALQSIVFGIGASILGMVFASFGFIPPIFGAGLQEAIDVLVIANALRAARVYVTE